MQILKHKDFVDQTASFDEASQIWIYYSQNAFNDEQTQIINQQLKLFLNQWNAHKVALEAAGMILYNRCIVLCVNQETAKASGCSVDASVRFIKELGMQTQIDFFKRDLFYIFENDTILPFVLTNLNLCYEKNQNLEVLSPFYSNLKDFRNNFTQKIPFSAYKRMVNH